MSCVTKGYARAYPAYLKLSEKQWADKEELARSLISCCRCCPRFCNVDREKDERGVCGAGKELVIASSGAHFGEEPPISGWKGSGTIFFTFCPMGCVYCQNYPFSQLGQGRQKTIDEFVSIMIKLQAEGCHNINLVTPTHFVPQIFWGINKARKAGLTIPLVYNTSSYDSLEALSLMEGIIDIYLADIRYTDQEKSLRYSGTKNYPQASSKAIKEMYRQAGPLQVGRDAVALGGLLIRHLVLPNAISGTKEAFAFIAKELSPKVPVSLMSQYFPAYNADKYPELNRHITREEYKDALELLDVFDLTQGWRQGL